MTFREAELVTARVELPGGPIELRQPADWADLPDSGGVEWAPIAPYWAVAWRSGTVLARRLAKRPGLAGLRVIELGCGLALPSLVAARRGASALATDVDAEPLELARLNAEAAGVELDTEQLDVREPRLPDGVPFDLAIVCDLLYEETLVGSLLELLPRLAPTAIVASPERTPYVRFAAEARLRWSARSRRDGVVEMLELGFD